jgi:hypothetical protein
MSITRWLSKRIGETPRLASRRKARAARSDFRPTLEALEKRWMLTTLTVLNNHDSGSGSLRDAIASAKSGDTIDFAPSLNGQTIALTSNELAIKNSVDIEGPGAASLSISGGDKVRVFDIVSEGLTVQVAGLTITHGRTLSGAGGGGILNTGSSLTNFVRRRGRRHPEHREQPHAQRRRIVRQRGAQRLRPRWGRRQS